MPFLITPIEIPELGTVCCQPGLDGRTEALLKDDAVELVPSPTKWELYHANAYGDVDSNPLAHSDEIKEGTIRFGICCANSITLIVEGNIETLNDDYDVIDIKLNGALIWSHASVDNGLDDPWDTEPVGPITVEITLDTDRPCGNIIEITGSTIDARANNDVWWTIEIDDIS